jgi:hypothetical protein
VSGRGEFVPVTVKTIHRNKANSRVVRASQSASLGLVLADECPNVRLPRLRRGMVLLHENQPTCAAKYFLVRTGAFFFLFLISLPDNELVRRDLKGECIFWSAKKADAFGVLLPQIKMLERSWSGLETALFCFSARRVVAREQCLFSNGPLYFLSFVSVSKYNTSFFIVLTLFTLF